MGSEVDNKVKMIVEGLLLAAGRPLSLDNITQVFDKKERPDRKELKSVMEAIAEDCGDRGFELKEVASGYRFQVKQDLSEWVGKLWEEKPPRYTRALLETLSLIAYRQPITRGDIEDIRGVSVSPNIIRTLIDRDWIRVVGHRDVPGRPAMFATTKQFLDYFNLKNLQELPPLSEVKELEQPEPELDLNEELSKSRILDLPDDEAADEESRALTEAEEAELIAEEEAVELSKKPLDEILRMGVPEELLEAEAHEEEEDFDGEVGVDADLDDDDEDDLDVGLTDEDIAANEEFERNLREQSSSAEEDDAAGDEESEDIAPESNVIPLRGNEHQVQGEQETDFDFRVEDASHSPVSEFESDAVPDTAIDFVIEEEHQEDASEINFIGDEQDENL
ncbi:MAG: SMC-Scp complex subunit ScpB [Gammaproteobacteria bacterium]|nr:SMC-Scp complex subunit ScpB [Gammaproteobacteria bacterium]MDD9958182.1 SMC-Scp complex subunit ScpB [Gammaproteobacteria bacterium]